MRLLEPEVYGEFGLVTSVIGFISIFSFSQFIAHALQVRDESALDYQSHFTAGAVIMVSLCGVTNLVAVAFRWLPAYARPHHPGRSR